MGMAAGQGKKPIRAVMIAVPLLATMMASLRHPWEARAALAYGHNVVALVLWIVLFRSKRWYALVPLLVVAAATVVLLGGSTIRWMRLDGPWAIAFIDEALAVGRRLPDQKALGLGLSYVFLQAVHYSIWMLWIPREETRGAPLTFRMSWRSARRDFGVAGLAVTLGAAALVIALSIVAVHRTRALYLSLATFHGYLEIAALAFLMARPGSQRGLSMAGGSSR
jgi:hypothetical protein